MEAKKKSPSAVSGAGTGAASPAAAKGYFSAYFPAPPAGNAKDEKPADLIAMLNKQSPRGQNGSGSITGGKSQGRATYKDGKHVYPNELSESPYFGSSVHYGGRDFYDSSQKKQTTEPPTNYKEDDSDGSATRGDWWQGSLYY